MHYAPNLHETTRDKLFYTLVMFPYPSGFGLHAGHASNFVINDVLARYKRLQGYTVFNPFGFDSFGLPTENYAMKLGKPAYEVIAENIVYFKSQTAALDLSFDTEREVVTSSPEYYKRTQWLFQQLYKAGLVYRDTFWVNRCPECQTVLANDQVVEGMCERCKSEIIQKKHPQWFIKITDYADRLITDLDLVDRPEETKIAQKNWIGRSEGAEIIFKISEDGKQKISEDLDPEMNKISYEIIGSAYDVHKALGSGLTEKIYHNAMILSLQKKGFLVESEKTIPLLYQGEKVGYGKVDILINGKFAVELKSRKLIEGDYLKQLRTYMNQGGFQSGLILNFYNKSVETIRLNKEKNNNLQQSSDKNLQTSLSITVFTTRPDTIYGVTALVLAPENTFLDGILSEEYKTQVEEYRQTTLAKTAVQRQKDLKEKTGVFSGLYATHPLTGEDVAIWYADYVLADYGTGAVMMVPAHDERDWEFAKKFGIEVKKVIARETGMKRENEEFRNGGSAVVFDPKTQRYAVGERPNGRVSLFAGGANEGESVYDCILREIQEESGLYNFTHIERIETAYPHFFNQAKQVNRVARSECLLVILANTETKEIALEEHEKLTLSWKSPSEIQGIWNLANKDGHYDHYLRFLDEAVARAIELGYDTTSDENVFVASAMTEYGFLEHSGQFTGLSSQDAKSKIAEHLESIGAGRKKISYKLRDWSVSRQRYWGSPIPVYYALPDEKVLYFELTEEEKKWRPEEPTLTRNVIQVIVKDKDSDMYAWIKRNYNNDVSGFFGGIDDGENEEDALKRELLEEGGFTNISLNKKYMEYHCKFYHPVKKRNQYSMCHVRLVEADRTSMIETSNEEKKIQNVVRMHLDDFLAVSKNETTCYVIRDMMGISQKSREMIDKYNEFNPLPEELKVPHLIPEDELPVLLPLDLDNYKPTGKSPLEDHPTFPVYTPQNNGIVVSTDDLKNTVHELRFPVLIHGKEKTGASYYTVKLVSELVKQGKKIFFFSKYEQAKELLIESLESNEYAIIDENGVEGDGNNNVLIWNNGNQDNLGAYLRSHTITDYILVIKNCDSFDATELIQEYGSNNIIVSGDADQINLGDTLAFGTIIAFSDYQEIMIGDIGKYNALMRYTGNTKYLRECDTLDTFMCSSFYFLRYPDANNPNELCDPQLLNKCFPIDFYIGGKEHTVGHLLYARFIHKFLYDQGYVSSPEPFQRLVHQGMVLGADGRKMSKRRGNVIDPIEVVEKYGADAVRTYLMFMGPVEQEKVWNDGALAGVNKFLGRIRKISEDGTLKIAEDKRNDSVERALHKAIKGLTDDMEALKYNTAVSKLMILLNSIEEQKTITKGQLEQFMILLFPFAPKTARTIWEGGGNKTDIEYAPWPVFDATLLVDETISLPVQINGKVRANIIVAPDAAETTVMDIAQQDEHVQKYLAGQTIRKVIYVQGRILNIVI